MDNTNIIAQKCGKKAQEVVLQLIETTVEERELQHLCGFITPGQFEDVCLERCIAGICGYPLCQRPYEDEYGTRQYVIRNKAVYDISRRRNFCSNVCFEASLRLLSQIPSSPLYLRGQGENERQSIVLPDLSQLKGLYGDKVKMNNSMPLRESDVDGTCKSNTKNHCESKLSKNTTRVDRNHKKKNNSKNLKSTKYVPQEENASIMKAVESSEKNDSAAADDSSSSGVSSAVENNYPVENDSVVESNSPIENVSIVENNPLVENDSTLENNCNSTVHEVSILASAVERHADAPLPLHRTAGAEAHHASEAVTLNSSTVAQQTSSTITRSCPVTTTASASQVEEHLREWLRWSSYVLLLGHKILHERCGLTLPSSAEHEDSSFTKRAARIRSLHAATLTKIDAFYKGTNCNAETTEDEQKESWLPLIDEHNIHSWRRNVFLQKLAPCEQSLVARLQLPKEEVREKIKAVVFTLHLTQHNLYLRPAQWALVALVLLKLISVSCEEVRDGFMDDTALHAEVLPRLAVLDMGLQDFNALVTRLLEPPVLRKAYIEYQKLNSSSPCLTQCDDASPKSSEVPGSCTGVQNEANERSLSNIGSLSIAEEENYFNNANVSDQCRYSQIDALD
ncbi:Protein of unknown function DUF408 [Trinorchestia longiramus]|nr:Protein of unknown function DUF408 [Trinorchestia longiramus]